MNFRNIYFLNKELWSDLTIDDSFITVLSSIVRIHRQFLVKQENTTTKNK